MNVVWRFFPFFLFTFEEACAMKNTQNRYKIGIWDGEYVKINWKYSDSQRKSNDNDFCIFAIWSDWHGDERKSPSMLLVLLVNLTEYVESDFLSAFIAMLVRSRFTDLGDTSNVLNARADSVRSFDCFRIHSTKTIKIIRLFSALFHRQRQARGGKNRLYPCWWFSFINRTIWFRDESFESSTVSPR